jgi:integrase/recombinase XerD
MRPGVWPAAGFRTLGICRGCIRNLWREKLETAELKVYLTPDEVKLLEQHAVAWDRSSREFMPCLRDLVLIRVLFHLGCRISEALALEVPDIDFNQRLLKIQHLKTRIQLACPGCKARLGKKFVLCPQCGMKVEQAVARVLEHPRIRILPVDNETLDLLRDYIDRGGPVSRDGKQLLFGINRHRAWQIVTDCAHRAGLHQLVNPETGRIHGVSPHRLRDAFAVNAARHDDSGDGLRLLQEHLGHANIGTTMRYRKVAGRELRDWYDKLWTEEGKPERG